jgi:hypothetical protein
MRLPGGAYIAKHAGKWALVPGPETCIGTIRIYETLYGARMAAKQRKR